jgi:uncharacterized membrane protein YphA (DoxX/SURF4 family)
MVNSEDGKPAPIGTLMPVLGSIAIVIPLIARIIVGSTLVIAGALKIRQGSRNVTEAVLGYRLVSRPGAVVVGLALPWLEVGIGLALISDVMPALFYPAAMALVLILTTAVATSLVRGLQNECGCFGAGRRQRVRRSLVSRNLLLVVPLIGAQAIRAGGAVDPSGAVPAVIGGGVLWVLLIVAMTWWPRRSLAVTTT